ncbi:LysM peptidoglycan-binding domain-containing protein [Amycolatopsis speibonae]|uniref:LysM peptidoglycan-binding domain-containing protein n=1 Tax=Amycolatopsis speibonae TaxID=1450224 RepID=A0ABV7NWH8_9PSEU
MAAHRVLTSFALAVLFAGSLGGLAQAQERPSGAVVKYFVVPFSAIPDENTLFRIAEQTLGAGARYPEIFRLNEGRIRPDGTAFTDPASIQPGQVLQLPSDARGAIDGPLPAVPAAPPPLPAQTATPAASATSGSLVASLATGIGGALLGLLGGLRLRRAWVRRTPASPEPDPLDFPPSTGTLDLPWQPGGHAYFFLSAADTQVIAAVPADARVTVTVMTAPLPKPLVIDMPEDRGPQ